jgi:hypothetical protein
MSREQTSHPRRCAGWRRGDRGIWVVCRDVSDAASVVVIVSATRCRDQPQFSATWESLDSEPLNFFLSANDRRGKSQQPAPITILQCRQSDLWSSATTVEISWMELEARRAQSWSVGCAAQRAKVRHPSHFILNHATPCLSRPLYTRNSNPYFFVRRTACVYFF